MEESRRALLSQRQTLTQARYASDSQRQGEKTWQGRATVLGCKMRGAYTLKRRRGRHISSVREKVLWLRQHRNLWMGVEYNRELQKVLVGYMKLAHLVAPTTYVKDVHIEALIRLALERDGHK